MTLEKFFCQLGLFGHGPGNTSIESKIGYRPVCKKCGRIYRLEDVLAKFRYILQIGLGLTCFIFILGIYQFVQFISGIFKFFFGG